MRIVRIAAIPLMLLVVLGVSAAPAGAGPVLADDRYKWFYWIGPLLLLGAVLYFLVLGVGYYIRVIRPKYRGKPVRK